MVVLDDKCGGEFLCLEMSDIQVTFTIFFLDNHAQTVGFTI